MKKYFLPVLLFSLLSAKAQVTITINLPPTGLSVKSQLWNLFVTNSSAGAINVHAELRLTDVANNSQVLNASTAVWSLAPGGQVVQASTVAPIQYNITDPAYQQFNYSDFLPVGHFLACYSLWKHSNDGTDKIVEECDEIIIEPLSPPQLIYPYNESVLETPQPVFNWIPPAPVQLFTGMSYDLELVEMYPNQTEYDAVQQNIPLYKQIGISGTSWPYPAGAPSLEKNRKYAWRVSVRNSQAVVAQTEAWWFTLSDKSTKDSSSNNVLPYAKLKKGDGISYAIMQNDLKFEYLNESIDTVWNVRLMDLSQSRNVVSAFNLDSVHLQNGQNLIRIDKAKLGYLLDKHLYLLELQNSRFETWRLKFEYRRKEDQQF